MLDSNSEIDILSSKVPKNKIPSAGNIKVDKKNYVIKIHEKPTKITSKLAWAGLAMFKSNYIFKVIESLKPSFREEYDITEAMNNLLNIKKIRNHVCDRYIDCGTPAGLLEAVKLILGNRKIKIKSELKKSIISPTYIGRNSMISNHVTIGPFVSIGNNVTINENVSIKNSLILDNTVIDKNQIINKEIFSGNIRIKTQ